MDWRDVEEKWSALRTRVQERWTDLTAEDLEYIGGSYERLVSTLQETYGLTKQQAERELEHFQNTVRV
jgi:uncharacterized protein YjbJ (UPF0337 family)